MLKKSLALLAGMLCSLAVFAATSDLRANAPASYTVRKGDTLWSISAHFLRKPWLWPEIWQATPQLKNPHRIYPGDVLDLAYLGNGQGVVRLEPRVRGTDLGEAIAPLPLAGLKPFLVDTRVFPDRAALAKAPYVVGFEENQLRGVAGQFVYVRGLDAKPGEHFAVVRPSHVFLTFHPDAGSRDQIAQSLDSNVEMYSGPWHRDEMGYADRDRLSSGHALGYEGTVIGTVEVLRGGDPATLLALSSHVELRKGDRILPLDTHPYDSDYYPHAPKALPPNMRVIAFSDAMDAVGPHQVVALSAGKDEGVDNGQTYSMYQSGDRIHDDVASSSQARSFGQEVTLPAEFIGHVMIFRTFDHVSYGLVMDGVKPVHLGAQLRMPD